MNKIIIENSVIKERLLDDTIRVSYDSDKSFLDVNNLKIDCLSDTSLTIYYYNNTNTKMNIIINCLPNSNVRIFEKYLSGYYKIRSNYNLDESSYLNIQKFYNTNEIKQLDTINLNGNKARIDYVLKTISENSENYNLVINHNAPYTKSNIINNAVNINDGKVIFSVTGTVLRGNIKCELNQTNRIVTFNKQKCQINPNLLIDENDVIANHSAFIGKFDDEEIFYLQSRGIKYEEVMKLLVKGFLFENLIINEEEKKELEVIIQKYWG